MYVYYTKRMDVQARKREALRLLKWVVRDIQRERKRSVGAGLWREVYTADLDTARLNDAVGYIQDIIKREANGK